MLAPMIRSFKTKTVAIATVGLLAAGGGAYAAAGGGKATTPLTGGITDRASAAVNTKYPGGTLVGIRSRPDGTVEAQVRRADGTFVSLTLDEDFEVTATRVGGPGRGGPGRGIASAELAKALGVTDEELRTALQEVRPQPGARKDERVTAIAEALGAQESDVADVLAAQRDAGPGGPRGGTPGRRGDRSALIAALAKRTDKTEAAVRAALRDARPEPGAHRDALAAALAKELGLETAKVEAALEAARQAGGPGRRP